MIGGHPLFEASAREPPLSVDLEARKLSFGRKLLEPGGWNSQVAGRLSQSHDVVLGRGHRPDEPVQLVGRQEKLQLDQTRARARGDGFSPSRISLSSTGTVASTSTTE